MSISYFHYVRFSDVESYERCGWEVEGVLPDPHGQYAVMMKWPNKSEPVKPQYEEADL